MVKVSCKVCRITFGAKPSHVGYGWAKYCSRACAHAAARKGKEVLCSICGTTMYRSSRDLERSNSGKYFCSKSCQTLWRNRLFSGEKHSNFKYGTASYRQKMLRSGVLQACTRCATNDQRVLAVHHIDQNRKNNSIENLTYLCHNCHHLVHRYPKERDKFMAAMV